MKNFLFPKEFQLIGWLIFVPAVIAGILMLSGFLELSGTIETVVNDAVIIGIALGAVFVVCAKEPIEDEMTRSIRLNSLLKSLYIYVGLLIVSTLAINGMLFLYFMAINLVLFPLIYVVTFRIEIHRYNKLSQDEEQD